MNSATRHSHPQAVPIAMSARAGQKASALMSDMDGDILMAQTTFGDQSKASKVFTQAVVSMDCDDGSNTSSMREAVCMSSRDSADSLASSASSTSLNQEPELSQSFGSTKSYDLMTPIKPFQSLQPSMMQRDDTQTTTTTTTVQRFNFNAELLPSTSSSVAHQARQSIEPVSSTTYSPQAVSKKSFYQTFDADCSSSKTLLGLQLNSVHGGGAGNGKASGATATDLSAIAPGKLGMRRVPPGLAGRLKINLPTSLPHEGPTTPGGHVAQGARDGAGHGVMPLSPFEPPTPLLLPRDHSTLAAASSSSSNALALSPTSASASRPKMAHRHSSGRANQPLAMSPLAKELSSLGMRKTMSSKGSDSSSSSSQRSTVSDISSTFTQSTLFTPPYSPLMQSKGLPAEYDSTLLATPQRSTSGGSASSSASSTGKAGRSSVSPRPKATKANKVAPYPSPRGEDALNGTPSAKLGSVPMVVTQSQPASSYFGPPLSPTSNPTSSENNGIKDDAPMSDKSTLAVVTPQAAKMEKSLSEPAPRTVSARHLANKQLHPVFARTYSLGDELGSGGFGFVVSATRIHDGMPVAVKFIWKDKVPSHGWVRDDKFGAIPMEAFVLKVIDSPFVVRFVDLFADSEFFYLVMEHHGTPWQAPQDGQEAASSSNEEEKNTLKAATSTVERDPPPPPPPPPAGAQVLPAKSSLLTPIDISAPSATSPTFAVFPPGSDKPEHLALSSSPTSLSVTSDDDASDISSITSISSSLRPAPMERRSSCDLFECIEQHSHFSEDRARWVFAQIVEAVYDLDKRGICHRDIKDENCVVDADFNVKLIDFGSAVITDPRRPTPYFNRFFGTMTFASSEILQGKQYRAPHAEIWSLGVLLSILLSGECPFSDPQAAIKGRISKPSKPFSSEASDLLRSCLHVDPDCRATIRDVREHPWVVKAWAQRGRTRPSSSRRGSPTRISSA